MGIVLFWVSVDPPEEENIIEENSDFEDPISTDPQNEVTEEIIQCLKEAGVVVYGTEFCSACISLRKEFGGDETISPIYVDCGEDRDVCSQEKETRYVPEIQIEGELYQGSKSPFDIAKEVNCEI